MSNQSFKTVRAAIVICLMAFFPGSTTLSAQKTIQNYRYLIVPNRFAIQKEAMQYGLNTMVKNYFKQWGMLVFMSDEQLPPGISHCDKLFVDIAGSNNMIRTVLQVVVSDCNNQVIATSPEGADKNKNNQIAFSKALRIALKGLCNQPYVYSPLGDEQIAENSENLSQTTILKQDFELTDLLYAQLLTDGFQLVDTTPKVVLRIYKTAQPDTFSATDGMHSGVLMKVNNQWVYEYFVNGKKETRVLQIKF